MGIMKCAFLGAGKMASALVRGILRAELCAARDVTVSDPSVGNLRNLSEANGVRTAASNAEAAAGADVVVLCVKPADALGALREAGDALRDRLLVSIVAGLRTGVAAGAAPGCRIVRAMPNTAAMVGRSATAIASDSPATQEDLALADTLFSSVGSVVHVAEDQMDAITGLSGSGPAYVYLMLEALCDGAVAAGLPRHLASSLAIQTLAGAAEMASSTSEHPAVLREMVTSPAGTTSAGLMALERAGVRHAFAEAVRASAARAAQLAID
jgi:pyrroline-5-carboxylate reductase